MERYDVSIFSNIHCSKLNSCHSYTSFLQIISNANCWIYYIFLKFLACFFRRYPPSLWILSWSSYQTENLNLKFRNSTCGVKKLFLLIIIGPFDIFWFVGYWRWSSESIFMSFSVTISTFHRHSGSVGEKGIHTKAAAAKCWSRTRKTEKRKTKGLMMLRSKYGLCCIFLSSFFSSDNQVAPYTVLCCQEKFIFCFCFG